MKRIHATFLVLASAWFGSAHAILAFSGTVGYSINGSSVTLSVDRLENTSTRTSGPVHVQLIATFDNSLQGTFYRLADADLALLPNQFSAGGGRMPPGSAFTDIEITTAFNAPPDGTYFFHLVVSEEDASVPGNGLDTFLDSATFPSTVTEGSPPPAIDQHANNFGGATRVAVNTTQAGAINFGGDVDFFRIALDTAGTLTVSTTGNLDTFGTLYDGDRQLLVENDDGSDFNFVISQSLTAGTYFLAVQHFHPQGTGNYTLVTQFVTEGLSLDNDAAVTGIFFDPSSSGQGFNFNYGDNGLTIFFYGHGASGGPLWLVSESLDIDLQFGEPVVLTMFDVPGGTFGNPDPGTLDTWGTLTLTLDSCDSGMAVLDGVDGSQTLNLQRLSGVAGLGCQ